MYLLVADEDGPLCLVRRARDDFCLVSAVMAGGSFDERGVGREGPEGTIRGGGYILTKVERRHKRGGGKGVGTGSWRLPGKVSFCTT